MASTLTKYQTSCFMYPYTKSTKINYLYVLSGNDGKNIVSKMYVKLSKMHSNAQNAQEIFWHKREQVLQGIS